MVNFMIFEKIAGELRKEAYEAWLFYSFQSLDPISHSILEIPSKYSQCQRWFYLVTSRGEATKLVHYLDHAVLDHLPGQKVVYHSWRELEQKLAQVLTPLKQICMQYSPFNAVPQVSYVDAGIIELIRKIEIEIVSSADLVQKFLACWSPEGLQSHLRAASKLRNIVDRTFSHVRESMANKRQLSEYLLQQFIIGELEKEELFFERPPTVALNSHSGNPYYQASEKNLCLLADKDFLLINLWGKEMHPEGIYADITWTGYLGKQVPEQYKRVFQVVKQARDAAIALIKKRLKAKKPVYGYEVDDVCRKVIAEAGYEQSFPHRTGHSLEKELNGRGVHLDNLDTKDERKLVEGLGFSIAPGIYLDGFGIRSEVNAYIHQGQLHISGDPIQQEIVPILAS